jgi:4-alpha-glucanotransferase
MYLNFEIEYQTQWGQNMFVCGNIPELGNNNPDEARPMKYESGGKWKLQLVKDQDKNQTLEYYYMLKDQQHHINFSEFGAVRSISFKKLKLSEIFFRDTWRSNVPDQNIFFSSAFTRNLFKPDMSSEKTKGPKGFNLRLQVYAPRVGRNHKICVLGDDKSLGKWNVTKPIILNADHFPIWSVDLQVKEPRELLQYKYGIYDVDKEKLLSWEEGENRKLQFYEEIREDQLLVKTDNLYRQSSQNWKAAGVAIPVFSLRTKKSGGVGEFKDLIPLIDWAHKTDLKMVQILPVNDTVATHRWLDSYPYAAISVFALHPIYLNLPSIGSLKDKDQMKRYVKELKKLNEKKDVDYEAVMKVKSAFFKNIFDEQKNDFLNDAEFIRFFNQNQEWLIPYAVFSRLRDLNKTPEFESWPELSDFDRTKVEDYASPDQPHFEHIAVHYFIQYHLHKQLSDASAHARKKGVVLKGDIPIGIYRNSVDAWVAPHLYHMNKQAGAPPDAYAIAGQNWKFPTYNWEEMAKDGYQWWRKRLQKMAEYFDAYRIDHILGFFRIWEIPSDSVEGLMGKFNPSIPMYIDEMRMRGLHFDYDRFCKPFIRHYMLQEIFGNYAAEVENIFLIKKDGDRYEIKEAYNTQKKVEAHSRVKEDDSPEEREKKEIFRYGMYQLLGNVLFFEEPGSNGTAFHPKIALHQTHSYRELDDNQQNILNGIYIHYYYHRQESFWRSRAMEKLPAITAATDMLVCGEDLGMVPDCVPGVMNELGILSLNIQRMPKGTSGEFGHPSDYEYLSVCSPSCHDMSTIRGWWEEDRSRSQRFFEHILGHQGPIPYFCEPWLCREMIIQHLYSPSMWAVFPIQDLLAMDDRLRNKNTQDEQINVPSNPQHFWKYRFHLNIEDLLEADDLNKMIADLVQISGRSVD